MKDHIVDRRSVSDPGRGNTGCWAAFWGWLRGLGFYRKLLVKSYSKDVNPIFQLVV